MGERNRITTSRLRLQGIQESTRLGIIVPDKVSLVVQTLADRYVPLIPYMVL